MGKLIKNKNKIKFYYEIDNSTNKINILDSNKNYFNDLYLDFYDIKQDIKNILDMLKETSLISLCNFFGARKYGTIEKLIKDEELEETKKSVLKNEYLNIFKVGKKFYYTWSE